MLERLLAYVIVIGAIVWVASELAGPAEEAPPRVDAAAPPAAPPRPAPAPDIDPPAPPPPPEPPARGGLLGLPLL